jgi:ATP-dependent Lhr-like helicase
VLRWQGVHPDGRRGGADGLGAALAKLEGVTLPANLWEQAVLPARVPGYQPRWLDEWVGGGAGAWVMQGDAIAFLAREEVLECTRPGQDDDTPLPEEEGRVLELLRGRGASFVVDLAHSGGMPPSRVRECLWSLAGRALVSNDHFDVVRRGREETASADAVRRAGRYMATSLRRGTTRPEGRWSLLPWAMLSGVEEQAIRMAVRLLRRYGVAARELALMGPWMPPWRVLYEVLSRMELAGEVRRGYFAEGLSGAQFALPEACRMLQEQHLPSTAAAPVVLLHGLDPANLYGAGAPLDVPLLDGGTRSFVRRAGNWIVLRAGKPVLLVEQLGKKVTALPTAAPEDVRSAVRCLPSLCEGNREVRYKLTVEEWNGRPVTTTEGRELLEEAGFVRDYQGMTLYAVWR